MCFKNAYTGIKLSKNKLSKKKKRLSHHPSSPSVNVSYMDTSLYLSVEWTQKESSNKNILRNSGHKTPPNWPKHEYIKKNNPTMVNSKNSVSRCPHLWFLTSIHNSVLVTGPCGHAKVFTWIWVLMVAEVSYSHWLILLLSSKDEFCHHKDMCTYYTSPLY